MNNLKWIFVSAALGDSDMLAAGKRIEKQAGNLGIFDQIRIFYYEDLEQWAPFTWNNYRNYLSTKYKGFGYFSWKSELVLQTLKSFPNHGLVWADAGCEIQGGLMRKLRLRSFMYQANRTGSFLYTLNYPEYQFTKLDVYEYFPDLVGPDSSSQIQATWFLLAGTKGLDIASRWFSSTSRGIHMLDMGTRFPSSGLVEHRFDQSLLSLTCKQMKISPKRHFPAGRPVTFFSTINCFFHPIWASRNRSGISLRRKKSHWNCFKKSTV